jgi:uncharacterized protein (TIGR00266 family)
MNQETFETSSSGFEFKIIGRPDFSFLIVRLPQGQTLRVEAGSMAARDTHVSMKTKMARGLTRLLTGESIFQNEFTAERAAGELSIAPGAPGDIAHIPIQSQASIFLTSSAYLASTTGVNVESKWEGFVKGLFSGNGLFLARCSGQGDLWLNSFGALKRVDVKDSLIVDTGHVMAFTEGLQYNVQKLGGYKSLFLSQEGLVMNFRGQGTVWIQTRKLSSFVSWIHWYRPQKKKS